MNPAVRVMVMVAQIVRLILSDDIPHGHHDQQDKRYHQQTQPVDTAVGPRARADAALSRGAGDPGGAGVSVRC